MIREILMTPDTIRASDRMIPVQQILQLQDAPADFSDLQVESCGCGAVRRSYYASTVDTDPNRMMFTNNKHFYNILHVATMGFDLRMIRRALQAGADVHAYYYVDRLGNRRANTLGKIIIDYLNYQSPKLVSDIIALIVEHGYCLDGDRWMIYDDDDDDDDDATTPMTYIKESLRQDLLASANNKADPELATYMGQVLSCLKNDHNIIV